MENPLHTSRVLNRVFLVRAVLAGPLVSRSFCSLSCRPMYCVGERWTNTLSVLVLLGLVLGAHSIGPCKSTESPRDCTGPVKVSFKTPNCTGNPNYFELLFSDEFTRENQCYRQSIWTCSSTGFSRPSFPSSSCAGKPISTTAETVGVCIPSRSVEPSFVILCSADDPIPALAAIPPTETERPEVPSTPEDCLSVNNCPASKVWRTYYSDASCQNATHSTNFFAVDTNDTECYYSPAEERPNLKYEFSSASATWRMLFGGCNYPVDRKTITYNMGVCSPAYDDRSYMYHTSVVSVPPTVTETPSSDSNPKSLWHDAILVLVVCCIFLTTVGL